MRLRTALLAVVATAASLGMSIGPAQAQGYGVTYYSIPFAPTVFAFDADAGTAIPLTYDQWVANGSPTPTPAPTKLAKYSWGVDIYAVSAFSDTVLFWDMIDWPQWASTNYEQPIDAGPLAVVSVAQYQSSPELYVYAGGALIHKLTLDEWWAMGAPTPTVLPVGIYKLAWAPEGIAGVVSTPDTGVQAAHLTYEEWAQLLYPTPEAVRSLPGDTVCSVPGSVDLVYSGATFEGVLSFEQWQASGVDPSGPC